MQRGKERERERDRCAHLAVAVGRKSYSIGLTKHFENTLNLQECMCKRETKRVTGKAGVNERGDVLDRGRNR